MVGLLLLLLVLLQVVNHDKTVVADVLVEDGKIVAVGEDLELPQVVDDVLDMS